MHVRGLESREDANLWSRFGDFSRSDDRERREETAGAARARGSTAR